MSPVTASSLHARRASRLSQVCSPLTAPNGSVESGFRFCCLVFVQRQSEPELWKQPKCCPSCFASCFRPCGCCGLADSKRGISLHTRQPRHHNVSLVRRASMCVHAGAPSDASGLLLLCAVGGLHRHTGGTGELPTMRMMLTYTSLIGMLPSDLGLWWLHTLLPAQHAAHHERADAPSGSHQAGACTFTARAAAKRTPEAQRSA